MKSFLIVPVIILLIIVATSSYFIGLETGKKRTRIIYYPKTQPAKNYTDNSYNLSASGVVKDISEKGITLDNSKYSTTFSFKSLPNIYMELATQSSSLILKDNVVETRMAKGQLKDIHPKQKVYLDLFISKDSLSVNSITVFKD